MGSRFGGSKQITDVTGFDETIADFSVYDARLAGFTRFVFIVNQEIEAVVRERYSRFLGERVETVVQQNRLSADFGGLERDDRPWGTGHALISAQEAAGSRFAVLNADDFYGRSAFRVMARHLLGLDNAASSGAMIGYKLSQTLSDTGGVSRGLCDIDDDGELTAITEVTGIVRSQDRIVGTDLTGTRIETDENRIVSMNFWGFTSTIFELLTDRFRVFLESGAWKDGAEFYLPQAVNEGIQNGDISVEVLSSSDRWAGVTFRDDLESVREHLARLRNSGEYPEKLFNA